MGLGASIIIFAIGAILTFGINVVADGVDLDAIGVILMIVGIIGGLVSAMFLMTWSPWSRRTTVVSDGYAERPVYRERRVVERDL